MSASPDQEIGAMRSEPNELNNANADTTNVVQQETHQEKEGVRLLSYFVFMGCCTRQNLRTYSRGQNSFSFKDIGKDKDPTEEKNTAAIEMAKQPTRSLISRSMTWRPGKIRLSSNAPPLQLTLVIVEWPTANGRTEMAGSDKTHQEEFVDTNNSSSLVGDISINKKLRNLLKALQIKRRTWASISAQAHNLASDMKQVWQGRSDLFRIAVTVLLSMKKQSVLSLVSMLLCMTIEMCPTSPRSGAILALMSQFMYSSKVRRCLYS